MSATCSGANVVRALRKKAFEPVSQKGSHLKLRDGSGHVVIVPMHAELRVGTLRSILRQAGLSLQEFVELVG